MGPYLASLRLAGAGGGETGRGPGRAFPCSRARRRCRPRRPRRFQHHRDGQHATCWTLAVIDEAQMLLTTARLGLDAGHRAAGARADHHCSAYAAPAIERLLLLCGEKVERRVFERQAAGAADAGPLCP